MTRSLLLLALLVCAAPARADYALPLTKERFVLLAESWQLDGERLTLTRGEQTFALRVDTFWLADRVNSSSICTGTHEATVRAYLDDLRRRTHTVRVCELIDGQKVSMAKTVPAPLWVEVVRVDQERFVAGLWPATSPEQAHAAATQLGSYLLGLTAEEVRALGADGFAARSSATSENGWRRLAAPAPSTPAATDSPSPARGR